MSYRRVNLANALFFLPSPLAVLLPLAVRSFTALLSGGVRVWLDTAWVDLVFLVVLGCGVLLRWNAMRVAFGADCLGLRRGVLVREEVLVPTDRLVTLSGTGYLPLRPFGVRLIAAVTPAGLPGQAVWQVYLSKRDAAALFAAQAGETAAESPAAVYRPKHGSVVLLSMLTSNSLMGFLMLAGLIRETGALAGDTLRRELTGQVEQLGSLLGRVLPPAAATVAALLLICWGAAFLAEVTRNLPFRLIRHREVAAVHRGLFTRRDYAVSDEGLCGLEIRETALSRLLGFGSLWLRAPGLPQGRGELLPAVPVVSRRSLAAVMGSVFPELEPVRPTVRPGARALPRYLRAPLAGVAACGALYRCAGQWGSFWRPWVEAVLLFAAVGLGWYALVCLLDWHSAGVGLGRSCLTLRTSRGLRLCTEVVPLRRVAAVEFRQGVLVRPGGRCDLLVTVMGRAGDRIRVRGVEKSAAWALLKEAGVLTAEEL